MKGIVWWGAESSRAVPGGLEKRSIDELLGVLERYGFNAIKIPFLHQFVLFDEQPPEDSFDRRLNPQLLDTTGQPIKYIAMLRAIAKRAASRGMLVFFVAHSLEGLWYSRSIKEATILDSWTSLSRQLCSQWNVVGVDLKNRPWAASWGKATPYDWDKAAARLGTHVHNECPRWLIGVQGVGESPGAAQDAEAEFAQMYPRFHAGENLVGARSAPVQLSEPSRLVYMPHTYGPGVRSLPYMEIDDFPENTEQVWEEHFLFLRKRAETRQPAAVVLTLGGPYESSPRDRLWQDWALRAAAAHGLSVFYDGLNPKSVPTADEAPLSAGATAGMPTPIPRAKRCSNGGGVKESARAKDPAVDGEEDGEDESTSLCSGTTPRSAAGKSVERGGGSKGPKSAVGTKKSSKTSGASKGSRRGRRSREEEEEQQEAASSDEGDEPPRAPREPRLGRDRDAVARVPARSLASLSWED